MNKLGRYASAHEIANKSGLSWHTVNSTVKDLYKLGLVEGKIYRGKQRNRTYWRLVLK
ncbi:MAG TPA: hypothetical protein VKN74_02050 [Candidatus Mcinerneyibacterium sp.]|nr:hypothetical protein [Candidatus Mcinerneyibacterium sp.]